MPLHIDQWFTPHPVDPKSDEFGAEWARPGRDNTGELR